MCYFVVADYISPVTMLSFPINDLVTVAKSKETPGFCLGPNSDPIHPRLVGASWAHCISLQLRGLHKRVCAMQRIKMMRK